MAWDPSDIDQRLATMGLDSAHALLVTGRFILILRDPQPDEADVPVDSTIRLRAVDLDGAPAAPLATLSFQVYVDQGAGDVLGYDTAVGLIAPWNGPRAAVTLSNGADPYCFVDVTLDQDPAVFASEGSVQVRVFTAGGWGHGSWGHFPWGHSPAIVGLTNDAIYAFTAADVTPPNLTAAVAIDRRTVRATFDDAMTAGTLGISAWTIDRYNVDPYPGVNLTVTAVAVVAGSGDTQWDLTTQWEQTPGCAYELTVAATAADDAGNLIVTRTASFDGFTPAAPVGRRFLYWDLCVPAKNKAEDDTLDLARFAHTIDEVLGHLLVDVDEFTNIFDPDLASDAVVDLMLWDLGNPFTWSTLELTATQRRKLLRLLVPIYRAKGTAAGIEAAILLLLGEVVHVVDALSFGWVLGVDALGDAFPAQVRCDASEPYDFSGSPSALTLLVGGVAQTFTFQLADFTAPAAAMASEVVAALNGLILDLGTMTYSARPGGGLTDAAAFEDKVGAAATGAAGAAEPYVLAGGETITGTIDGAPLAVTFHAADFAVPGAATAAEVAARLMADVGGLAAADTAGTATFATVHTGATAEITFVAGTALAALAIAPGASWSGTEASRVTIYATNPADELQITGGAANAVLQFYTDPVSSAEGAILAASAGYTLYSFDLETDGSVDAATEAIMRRIANYMKPAHTHLLNVRPADAAVWPDGWVLSVDMLDEDAELGP